MGIILVSTPTYFMSYPSLRLLYNALRQNHGIEILSSSWYSEGRDCEILKLGSKGWQKGKIKIKVTVEFCPDEPEIEETLVSTQAEVNQSQSPLDDIRQMMNGNS